MLFQQVQPGTDTVFVSREPVDSLLARALDSIAVRLVDVPDTLHAIVSVSDTLQSIVRQVGDEWYAVGSLLLAVALLGVTLYTHNEMRTLQERSNQMEAKHEADRRADEAARAQAYQRATDARIAALAFAVDRQVRSWLEEAPDELKDAIPIVDTWEAERARLGETREIDPPIPAGMLEMSRVWAAQRSGQHFDRAEERMLQIVGVAPEASEQVATAARRALAMFYEATGRMNRQASLPTDQSSIRELVSAYHDLERCSRFLDEALQLGRGRRPPSGPGK